jgi:hypothetical protein
MRRTLNKPHLRFFLLAAVGCALDDTQFFDVPAPEIRFVSPTTPSPGQPLILVGTSLDLTPEDPNDLPGGPRPTPFAFEVLLDEQPIPLQAGDTLATTFLQFRLPDTVTPGAHSLQLRIEGQLSNVLPLPVSDLVAVVFDEDDPVRFEGLGDQRALALEAFFASADPSPLSCEFSAEPSTLLAVGTSGVIGALRDGTAVLTATCGPREAQITVLVSAQDDEVLSLSVPESISLAVGESLALPIEGLTALGDTVPLAAASRIFIEGDETALPISRDENGLPIVTALAEGSVRLNILVGDGLLGSVQTIISTEAP